MRIALMDRTAPEVIREVEQVMERKLSSLINQDLATAGGVKPLVDILNFVDRATEGNILQTVRRARRGAGRRGPQADVRLRGPACSSTTGDPAAAEGSRDEGRRARAQGRRTRTSSAKIFGNMSTRAAQMLQEDMEFMGPVKRRAIEEAQGRIVAIVRRLEETGKIEIARGAGTDDELVV